jgi:hypothetical protein
MWTVVVATALGEPMQVMVEPLRGSPTDPTDPISKVDTKGRVPSSDVLEKINTVECDVITS